MLEHEKKNGLKHWVFFTDAVVSFFPSGIPLLILKFSKNKSLAQSSSMWIQERIKKLLLHLDFFVNISK